jgi:hypothetical protein
VAAKQRSRSAGSELSLDPLPARRERKMRRLAAVVAPVAADAGAVVDDPELLELARAVCSAFGAGDTGGGLTRAQIVERVGRDFAADAVDSRLHVFEKLGLLRPYLDKKHQQRYTLNPAGLVGQQVFDRIGERGGVDELITLLDRTRSLFDGRPDEEEVRAHVRHLTELLAVDADAGGVRIAEHVLGVAPAAALLDAGAYPHARREKWVANGLARSTLERATTGPAAALARACLARGYPVEQESAIVESVADALQVPPE